MKYPPISYNDYLHLNTLLSTQQPRSQEFGKPAHDETLFIIIHQVYELWFKQILHEVDSAISVFAQSVVNEMDMGVVVSRLQRVVSIQRILISQIEVLETMAPQDFLEFRDMLFPASGFQSHQFRLFENKLGLPPQQRLKYNQSAYYEHLDKAMAEKVIAAEKSPSLFVCIEKWLERTPFLNMKNFDFWQNYRIAVLRMFENDKAIVNSNTLLSSADKQRNLKQIQDSEQLFQGLFDEEHYNSARQSGQWRFSYKAIHAALLIQIYRDQPILHLPYRLITALLDIDESLTAWRYRHALMARRMLGTKIGTGGSSGHQYLQETSERHSIFTDLFQLTTFFIPRSLLPELPSEVTRELGFFHTQRA